MPAFTAYAYPATGATTARTEPDREGQVVNVKDFGALGNSSADDTDAIRAAIAAAFGAPGSPHGGNEMVTPNQFNNRNLYFPAGDYRVKSLASQTISALANNAGEIRITVPSTAAYHTDDIVEVYGGTGSTVANGVWGISVDSPTTITLKLSSSTGISGYTANSATLTANPLQLRSVHGFRIYGASKGSTRIYNDGPGGGGVFTTNGAQYGRFSDMQVMASGWAANREITAIEVNYTGTGGVNIQAITFQDMAIGGSSTSTNFGIRIGRSGLMGSEMLFLNCHFGSCKGAGLVCQNQNALLLTMVGGQFQACDKGVWSISGAICNLYAVSFQENTDWDFYQGSSGSPLDQISLIGCRSESRNFVRNALGAGTLIAGCSGGNQDPGCFAACNGPMTIINCSSTFGNVTTAGGGGTLNGSGNFFDRSDWLDTSAQIHAFRAITNGFISNRDVPDSSGVFNISTTFSTLQPAHIRIAGAEAIVSDSTVSTPDAVIAGGGTNVVLAKCVWDISGTAGYKWKVMYLIK